MIFDTHAHYDDEAFQADRAEVLNELSASGIRRVVNVGANRESTENSLKLAEEYDFFYAAAGVHPSDTAEFERSPEETFREGEPAASLDWLRRCLRHPKAVAVGEIGLDYHWNEPDREIQKKWFSAQLTLAKELQKPVIIHSRDAAKDTLDLIREAGGPDFSMVIHCFSYGVEMAREYLNMGYYLGIGGVVTFANAKKLKEVVSYMPLDRLLLETDCPYLAPVPHRGKRNWSGYLPGVIQTIAGLKRVSPETVEQAAWENAFRFYRLPQPRE